MPVPPEQPSCDPSFDGLVPSDPTPRRRRRLCSRRLLVGAVLVAFFTGLAVWLYLGKDVHGSTARFEADAPYYYVYLVSLLHDHDLNFANEYARTYNWYRFGKSPTGLPLNVFGIGPGLLTAPFYAVGYLAARIARLPADGFSLPEIKVSVIASLFYSFGALLLAWRLCRRRFSGPPCSSMPFASPGIPILSRRSSPRSSSRCGIPPILWKASARRRVPCVPGSGWG